jgi:hypothetical protein
MYLGQLALHRLDELQLLRRARDVRRVGRVLDADPATRAQEARRLLAERREITGELERAKRDYLEGARRPSV